MLKIHLQVPIGTLEIHWNPSGQITRVDLTDLGQRVLNSCDWFSWRDDRQLKQSVIPNSVTDVVDQLRRYFYAGEPVKNWQWNQIDSSALTPFQSQVYQAALKIPHGETRTYAWVAYRIGSPQASRAVGQALKRNPFPIMIPCHRIVGSKDLGGFMGAHDEQDPEVVLKKWLLDHEHQYLNPVFPFLSDSFALKSFV